MFPTEFFGEVVSVDQIRSHIRALEGVRHPVAAPEALEHAADYIKMSLRVLEYEMDEHRFLDNSRHYRNIIGTRRGLYYPNESIVVLAHYDTVAESPGADDNASGVAVMLEIASMLAECQFERTIHFIGVSLEENEKCDEPCSGTRGSRALTAHVRENGWNIEGVFVLESVAYAGDSIVQTIPLGVTIPVPDVGNFIAIIGNERSKELTEAFARSVKRYRADLSHIVLEVPGNGEVLPDSRRSDHAPFWDEGFKAIMITDTTNFRSPHYHQPTDTLETLNLEFAAKVCCATAGAILDMARLAK